MEGFTYNGNGYIATKCYFEENRYAQNKNVRIDLFGDCGLGGAEPIITVTLNIGRSFPDDMVALNCYLEEGATLLNEMIAIGLVKEVVETVPIGYVSVPVCLIDLDVLKKYSS